MSDVLFPAVEDRLLGRAARAIQDFARSNRILKDPFPIGSYVMILDPTRTKKTNPVYEGPYKILRRTRGGSYQLLDHDQQLYQRSVAPAQMKLVSKDPSQDPLSFVVDRIVNHKGPASRREYLVRWKGRPASEDSWEPVINFDDEQVIRDYWARVSSNPRSHLAGGNVAPGDTAHAPSTVASATAERVAAPHETDEDLGAAQPSAGPPSQEAASVTRSGRVVRRVRSF
jgi:hypothetical protein